MGRKRRNNVYAYFNVVTENNQSKCLLCNKVLNTVHGTNLVKHLQIRHKTEHSEVLEKNREGAGNVIYEYIIEPASPASTNGDESSTRDEDNKPKVTRTRRSTSVESRSSRSSGHVKHPSTPIRRQTQQTKAREKNLIKKLAAQKLSIASMQKEVLQKEMEERSIKVLMIKEEREHRKEMRELEKQEIMLRIESLKAK